MKFDESETKMPFLKPCQLFENTRSLVHNDRIVMHGVLSIYIFKRYQSSEILIKDKDHQRQGRESTDIPALLCSPSPIPPCILKPITKTPLKRSQTNNCDAPRNRGNTLIFHQKYPQGNWLFCDLEKHR